MFPDPGRLAANLCILCLSAAVLYPACLRSSTIYFFELQTTRVLFLTLSWAVAFPFLLSIALFVVYKSQKRMKEASTLTVALVNDTKQKGTSGGSRKVSRTVDLHRIEENEESKGAQEDAAGTRVLKRMLSDLVEGESQQSGSSEGSNSTDGSPKEGETPVESDGSDKEGKVDEDIDTEELKRKISTVDTPSFHLEVEEAGPRSRSISTETVENGELKAELEKALAPSRTSSSRIFAAAAAAGLSPTPLQRSDSEESFQHSRTSSFGSKTQLVLRSRKNSVVEGQGQTTTPCDIYRQLGQIDVLSYTVGTFNLLPTRTEGPIRPRTELMEIIIDIIAVHVPIWLCVAAFHVVLVEQLNIKFGFYFYYHEEVMDYAALFCAFMLGAFHEYSCSWITNNVLALSSIYMIVSRVQPVSFQTCCVLVLGMALFDLFWIYVIDLLSTVVSESKAPLMLLIPRDNLGHKQKLSIIDIIVPGVCLNLILKYSSMYDPKMFTYDLYAFFFALMLTMFVAVWRRKITPALVLPGLSLIACSVTVATHPNDLWRFMIKH